MRAPVLAASMERRLLVNYRVDPDVLGELLPSPFRPALVDGNGVAGICLLRLRGIRPAGLPVRLGITSENAAHRVAVEWDTPQGTRTGVFVPRRHTSSRLATIIGGRMFPGWQHRARFEVTEGDGRYRIEVASRDREVDVVVDATISDGLMPGSLFANIADASRFFQDAQVGYAATPVEGCFDGVELGTDHWAMTPLQLTELHSSFFDDAGRFPSGSAVPDSAFLMSGLTTTWSPQRPMTTITRHLEGADS